MTDHQERNTWLDRPIFSVLPALTGEMLIFIIIIILAIVSRLYDIGARVMSHDENLHVYFSWLYSIGKGYQHTPLMHGPLLFHLTALSYYFFGASDFTARFPQAIASILTILLLWKWRRYLGRAGTLVAAGLALISPIMLYYGRYARNEAYIGLFFVLTLYAILRYFETGRACYLVLLTIATALHFTSKETAFIYTAQALLFLTVYLINRVTRAPWKNKGARNRFLIALAVGVLLGSITLGLTILNRPQVAADASQTAAPIIPGQILAASTPIIGALSLTTILLIFAVTAFLLSAILLVFGYGWENLRRERSFDMLLLLGTLVLPQLAAFPAKILGWEPLEYQFTWPGWNLSALWAQSPVRTAAVFLVLCLISVIIGLVWDKKHWAWYAVLFWGIYIIFYTSVFSNWQGFFTGSVGSLGYWLQQQGVQRGGQPWYYYLLIQIPIYEFLPALGFTLAAYIGLRRKSHIPHPPAENSTENLPLQTASTVSVEAADEFAFSQGNYIFPLLMWWTLSSLLAYTLAGEKMPWLTVHITLPMILLSGWGIGQIIEQMDWSGFRQRRGGLVTILLFFLFTGLVTAFIMALGAHPPFRGKTLEQLSTTGAFLLSTGVSLSSAAGLFYLLSGWQARDVLRIAVLVVFFILAILTGRAAIRAAFINPNNATEYLVYAHGAGGIEDVMQQVSEISSRTVGEKNLQVAYDNNLPSQGVSWSFKWYLRNYPNATSFDKPGDTLRNAPVIIVDQQNFENIKPIVGNNYYKMDYIRMVWPNQDYFALTWPRLKNALTDPSVRDAIFQIWLNRDYTEYARVTGRNGLTVADWQPSTKMQLFIRKDIAAQLWEYGISQAKPLQVDPYEKGFSSLVSDLVIGTTGNGTANSQLNAPRGLAVSPDGSLFVADSRNHRILHFDASGNILNTIGQTSPGCPYTQAPPPNVPIGTFCEPWAVAVSPDGRWIYIADTWNHRVQKLSADGASVKTWGTPNYDPVSSGPFGLWGPRGIVVDSLGHVLVADTGNKRIVIYDAEGNFISQFGAGGTDAGQFDEPVGLAFDPQGNLYVADTWNQRIQSFAPSVASIAGAEKNQYTFLAQWDIAGWNSQSLDNKPYLAADQQGHIFTADPDSFRILEFTIAGKFIRAWGGFGSAMDNIGLPSGIAVDAAGHIWVSDTVNNRLIRFTLP